MFFRKYSNKGPEMAASFKKKKKLLLREQVDCNTLNFTLLSPLTALSLLFPSCRKSRIFLLFARRLNPPPILRFDTP